MRLILINQYLLLKFIDKENCFHSILRIIYSLQDEN